MVCVSVLSLVVFVVSGVGFGVVVEVVWARIVFWGVVGVVVVVLAVVVVAGFVAGTW